MSDRVIARLEARIDADLNDAPSAWELPPLSLYEEDARQKGETAKVIPIRPVPLPAAATTTATTTTANASKILPADFFAYMPEHRYIFVPSRDLWPASSVNARCEPPTHADGTPVTKPVKRTGKHGADVLVDVPMSATEWLDEHQPIDQMTWAPGAPMVVRDKLVSNGGWLDRPGCAVFNLYIPPQIQPRQSGRRFNVDQSCSEDLPDRRGSHYQVVGASCAAARGEDQSRARAWRWHGHRQGHALGPGQVCRRPLEFQRSRAAHLLGRFNGFVKSVILRISEARDLGDVDRFAFYDHMKVYTAAPPDVLRCDEKNIREHSVINVCGVIITSNHKTDGIYLPADDRRHYVAWSDLARRTSRADYWNDIYAGSNTAVPRTSPLTWRASISLTSTQRHRRPRRRRFGKSWMPTARPRMPSWLISSTRLAIPPR